MKKMICMLILGLTTLAFAGCTSHPADNLSNVRLCNLDEYVIDDSVFDLSKDDLKSVIAAKISVMDLDLDAKKLKDEDMQAFGCKTVAEFERGIVEDIVYRRFVEDYYNYLLKNSVVEPSELEEKFTNAILDNVKETAAERGQLTDTLLREMYQMDIDTFKKHLSGLWTNIQIIFSFCDSQGIACSKTEIVNVEGILKNTEEFQCYMDSEEIKTALIRYFVLDEKLQDYIAEIMQYSERIASSLISSQNKK